MQKFLQLLEDSVILQAVLTVLIWGAIIYMVVTGQEVPELLGGAGMVIFGFYFGVKQSQAVTKALRG